MVLVPGFCPVYYFSVPMINQISLVVMPKLQLDVSTLTAIVFGVLGGALPGLSSPMAIALLIPFTIRMEPAAAIAMLAALYCAGTFGGSITVILINAPGAPPAAAAALHGGHPNLLGRTGEPDEVAHMIVSLCHPEAGYTTGQTIHVNGGAYLA